LKYIYESLKANSCLIHRESRSAVSGECACVRTWFWHVCLFQLTYIQETFLR